MTERSESERAELEALADLIDNANGVEVCTFDPMRLEHKRTHLSGDDIARLGGGLAALRRLAAQDQKPVAWRILCTDKSRGSTGYYYTEQLPFEPGENLRQRSEPESVYLSPPPAAGWDAAIEAARLAITELDCMYVTQDDVTTRYAYAGIPADPESAIFREVVQKCEAAVTALRHNAPPDSGAGKSVTDLRIYCGDNPLKWAEEFCQIKQKQGWSVADIDENLMLGWFANAIEQSTALRHNAPPDPGAGESEQPAVLTYTNYRGETSVRSIIPRSVRYGSTEWHPEPQWLLLAHDTEKQADREFALKDFGMPDHGGADAGVGK